MVDASKQVFDLLRQLSDRQDNGDDEEDSRFQSEFQSEPPVVHLGRVPRPTSVSGVIPDVPDPTTITKYTSALKYIVRYVAPNEFVMKEIGLMIQDQNRREQEWFARRMELIRKQNDRGDTKEELQNVLKLIGVENSQGHSVELDQARELQSYDLKVYQDQQRLVREQMQQLKDLKIPLFCIPNVSVPGESLKNDQRKILLFFKDLLSD